MPLDYDSANKVVNARLAVALQELAKARAELHEAILSLSARLSPVMSETDIPGKSVPAEREKIRERSSPVVYEIMDRIDGLNEDTALIRDILKRIDL